MIKDSFTIDLLKRIGISLLIIFAIIGATLFLGNDISNKSDYIYMTRADLNERLNSINQLADLRVRAKEAEPYIEKLEAALPKKDQLLTVSKEMEAVARKYNLGYGFKFVSDEATVAGSLKRTSFQISAQGSYENIINFMKDLEHIPYFINLTSIDIINQGKGFSAAIMGDMYFKSE